MTYIKGAHYGLKTILFKSFRYDIDIAAAY